MCKRYGGFLRVALADPLPERRWFRRGWVTFRREVNIKDICWNLNNIRVTIMNKYFELTNELHSRNSVTVNLYAVDVPSRGKTARSLYSILHSIHFIQRFNR